MNADTAPCDKCNRVFPLLHLDAKPSHRQFREAAAAFGQIEAIRIAGDRGYDFDRLECAECYGPGYVSLEN